MCERALNLQAYKLLASSYGFIKILERFPFMLDRIRMM